MPTRTQIERKAWQLLHEHDYASVPVDIEGLADDLGVEVVFEDMEDEVSAMLLIEEGEANAVINSEHHPNRQRFSLAHELGHFMLHVSDDNQLFVDRSFFRNQSSSIGESQQEIEANAFAAALLMPRQLIDESLPADDDIEIDVDDLAEEFEVSEHAMTIRLINLDYIAP